MKRCRFQGDGGHLVKKVMKTPLNMTKTATFILSSLNLLEFYTHATAAHSEVIKLLFVLWSYEYMKIIYVNFGVKN